jgi:hypothetical protein
MNPATQKILCVYKALIITVFETCFENNSGLLLPGVVQKEQKNGPIQLTSNKKILEIILVI